MEKYLLRIEGFGKVEHVSLDGGVFIDKCVFEDVTKELTKAREEVERLKGFAKHNDEWTCSINCSCGLDELLKEVK